jgi:hypothetical protein
MAMVVCAALAAPTAAQDRPDNSIMSALHANGVDAKRSDILTATIPSNGRAPTFTLAYVFGHDWCGSSGCLLQIFEERAGGLKPIDDYTLWTPVTLDGFSKSGYPIIGVWHHGGGVLTPFCDEIYLGGNNPVDTARQERLERRRCSSSRRVLIDWPRSKGTR